MANRQIAFAAYTISYKQSDKPERLQFLEMTMETVGSCNIVGFNDDTRVFCYIPVRYDVARGGDCACLTSLVTAEYLTAGDAFELAEDPTHRLAKQVYRLHKR